MINKSAASIGRAFDASIRRERSASIGCAGLTRLQRCREIQQVLFAYPGSPALTDAHWERLRLLLPPHKPPTGRPGVDHRLMVEGMLWIVRTGSSWRELPERFGPWSTVASRYYRWLKEGLWERILQVLLPSEGVFLSSA